MVKIYNDLMKSAKLTAAQNKNENGEAVDSIGELVALCERDEFIPKYYIDKPNDKADRVIQDMQQYTYHLVTEELGLENLIENSIKALERERESIQAAAESRENEEDKYEDDLFNYENRIITDQDFMDFEEFEQEEVDRDELTGTSDFNF